MHQKKGDAFDPAPYGSYRFPIANVMENVLAIESAIGGGSIALLSGNRVLGKWHGTESAARSEHLLKNINELLEAASVDKALLSRIVVSNGPGSYTGVRIGIATAMGLSRALGIPSSGVQALRAIAACQPEDPKMVVIPLGRSGYCWQVFSETGDQSRPSGPATGSEEVLLEHISRSPNLIVIAHADVYQTVFNEGTDSIVNFGHDVAVAVGTASRNLDEGLSPFYASENYVSRVSVR
jgi:tRNA threonylcarbamoyl adenosine modification protein YeaZ